MVYSSIKTTKIMQHLFSQTSQILLFVLLCGSAVSAEENESAIGIASGVDVVSSYVWRGTDYGNSPAFQPTMLLTIRNLEVSAWGSYSLMAQEIVEGKAVPYSEIDLSARYKFPTSSGTFALEVVDFFYPYLNGRYSDFKGNGTGQHTVSVGLKYAGTETFPIQLAIDCMVHNDAEQPVYCEVGYPVTISGGDVTIVAGVAKAGKGTVLYGISDDAVGFVNAGVSFSRSVRITESFSLPISTTFIMNPYASKAFLTFKVSL